MRTTLEIDDDVLMAAKEIARATGVTAGEALSRLARKGLERPKPASRVRNGVPLLDRSPGGPVLTLDLIKQLQEDDE
jgi:hypothetical protein